MMNAILSSSNIGNLLIRGKFFIYKEFKRCINTGQGRLLPRYDYESRPEDSGICS